MSAPPIAPALQRFVTEELSNASTLAERALEGTVQQLRSTGAAREPGLAAHRDAALQVATRHGPAFRQAFAEALQRQAVASLAADLPGASATGLGAAGLELMDEARVEIDIEISRVVQRIDTTAEWELRELQTFTSTLRGQEHVSAESNPLRPLAYATALWEAVCALTPLPTQRTLLLRTAAGELAMLLKTAWAAAATRLEARGVEPGIYRTLRLPSSAGALAREPTIDVTQAGALEQLLDRMPVTTRQPLAPTGPSPATETGFDDALRQLEADLQRLPTGPTPGNRGAAAGGRAASQQAVLQAAPAGVDRQIVELVSLLFEAALSDPRLEPGLRPAVARLQVPALRAALRDPAVLSGHGHPLWQLLDRLGEAGAAHPHADDGRLTALQALAVALADEVAAAPRHDTALFRNALDRLDAFLAEQLQHALAAAAPAVETLRLAEHREVLQQTVARTLAQRLPATGLPPLLQRFITETWAQVIAESMLRHGDEAAPTAGYLKASDDLLWSLQTPDHPQSRQRLLALLPGLLQRLREGMALVDVHEAEQQRVLDELMLVHTEALRPGGRGGAPATEASEMVRRVRDGIERDSLLPAPFSDSVIDLASMETVPAELLQPASAAAGTTDTGSRPIDALRPGVYRRLFVRGRWSRSQLLWRSDRGQFFLFADEVPGSTHSITRRALERLHEAGLVQPLEPRPLVQRAVDGLQRRLAQPGG